MTNTYNRISRRDIFKDSHNTEKLVPLDVKDEMSDIKDSIFFHDVMTSFENNRLTNAIFICEIKDREYANLENSKNITYDDKYSQIQLNNGAISGIYETLFIKTNDNINASLNNFFLIADSTIPIGADITYTLVTNENEEYPITPGVDMPMVIYKKDNLPTKFKIRVRLFANNKKQSPTLKAFAVLYNDKYIEDKLGLVDIDLSKPEGNKDLHDDEIILNRGGNEDNLLFIETKQNRINLVYDKENDELSKVEVYDKETSRLKNTAELIYGDYVNHKNETERVLLKVKTKKHFNK